MKTSRKTDYAIHSLMLLAKKEKEMSVTELAEKQNISRTYLAKVMQKLSNAGHELILWTYRHGDYLQAAVEYCEENGIEFYAVNKNHPNESFDERIDSRLITADVYIDDRNIGGLLPWREVEALLLKE